MAAIGNMASGIAHEFNNFLTIIKGNAQLSLMETSPAKIKESLKIIEETAGKVQIVINDLALFSKPKLRIFFNVSLFALFKPIASSSLTEMFGTLCKNHVKSIS